jgi:hypothetical protein
VQTAQDRPEEAIQPVQSGPWTLAFEHGELLPRAQDPESGIISGLNERAGRGKTGENRFDEDEHEPILFDIAQRGFG